MKTFIKFIFIFSVGSLAAQHDSGLPFITSFSPKEYKQGTQNFALLQDDLGIFYFGNTSGLLTYDGERWLLVPMPNKTEVHSLAKDENGRIYVGAQGDFGHLEIMPNGKIIYKSLALLLDSADRDFNDVWAIYTRAKEVIFRSTKGIYIFRNNTFKVIQLTTSNHRSFAIENRIFIRQQGIGLQELINDSLVTVVGGEEYKNEPIHAIFPYSSHEFLVSTETKGLFLYNGFTFTPFKSPVNSLILGQDVYGKMLPDSTYALGTRKNGLIIIDKLGNVLHQLGTAQGLASESVWAIAIDNITGNLWVATNNGISVVEINSPFSIYQNTSGIFGQIYALAEKDGFIYAAGSQGVIRKKIYGRNPPNLLVKKFEAVNLLDKQAWYFLSDSNTLLVSGNNGLFTISDKNANNIGFTGRAWLVLGLKKFPGYVIANTSEGIVLLRKVKNTFKVVRILKQRMESLYYFGEDEDGVVWINSPTKGIYRLQFIEGVEKEPNIVLYNSKNGLPVNYQIKPFNSSKGLRFTSEEGFYAFDKENNEFVKDSTLDNQLFGKKSTAIGHTEEDKFGAWMGSVKLNENSQAIGYYSEPGVTNPAHSNLFKRIVDFKIHDFLTIDSNSIFIGTSEGIVHFSFAKHIERNYPVLIREVALLEKDSLLAFYTSKQVVISNKANGIRFRFAAMGFASKESNEYQYILEGFDKDWSDFNTLSEKEYTNLSHGEYQFKVRARNQYNQLSQTASFPFLISTPWFQTIWAFIVYSLLAILCIYGFVAWRSYNLRKNNQRLEKLIYDRTLEIKQSSDLIIEKNVLLENQKEQIETQKENLENAKQLIQQKNQNLEYINQHLEQLVESRTEQLQGAYTNLLAVKGELDIFIYRSSHDIKGPLMRLLGLTNVAKADVTDTTALHYFKLLEKEINVTNRMLQKLIVYQYIKNIHVTVEEVTLSQLLEDQINQAKSLPNFNAFKIEYPAESKIVLQANGYLLGTAIHNLLENSLTFIGLLKPIIKISYEVTATETKLFISDNGKGIDESIAPKIYDMFYRGSELSKGAGLGLYIAKESINKLSGSLRLVELPDWQTTFEITLPK